jgi:hypothetical protein
MNFCAVCHNVYFIKVNDDNNMVYFCKCCGNEEVQHKQDGSICIMTDDKVDDATKYAQYMNKNLKYDLTLPRVDNIECVNPQCVKKEGEKNEVIYLKYDPMNMKYMYHCVHCETFWKH